MVDHNHRRSDRGGVWTTQGCQVFLDLVAQRFWDEDEEIVLEFELDAARRAALMNGLAGIGLTMQDEDKIAAFEANRG